MKPPPPRRPRQNIWGTPRDTRSKTTFDQNSFPIPDELVFEIFSRLPSKVIVICRCVCKLWSSMLCRQDFTDSFLTKSTARPQILFSCKPPFKHILYSVPQLQNPDGNSYVVDANPLAPFPTSHGFSSCTNGFYCDTTRRFFEELKDSVVVPVIYNPSTGQSLALPRLRSRWRSGHLQTYFGYDPVAKEFKVLSMTCPSVNNVYMSLDHQVLTLGAKRLSWRKVQCCIPHLPASDQPICISGVLYYKAGACVFHELSMPSVVPSMIVCFDLKTQKFSCVKLSSSKALHESQTLVNYNGRLGLLSSDDSGSLACRRSKSFELWVLRDAAKHEWSKHVYMLPLLWEDVVAEKRMHIVGMIGTDEIVLSTDFTDFTDIVGHYYVFYYNVESKTITKVRVQGMEKFQGRPTQTYLNYVENVKLL